jgi:hypothetical protein
MLRVSYLVYVVIYNTEEKNCSNEIISKQVNFQ